MAKRVKVQWSTSARRDIRHLVAYIGARRPAAAIRIVDELKRTVELLRQQPEMGPDWSNWPTMASTVQCWSRATW